MINKFLLDRELQSICQQDDETFSIIKDIFLNYPNGGSVDDYQDGIRESVYTFLENQGLILLSTSKKTFSVSDLGFAIANEFRNSYRFR